MEVAELSKEDNLQCAGGPGNHHRPPPRQTTGRIPTPPFVDLCYRFGGELADVEQVVGEREVSDRHRRASTAPCTWHGRLGHRAHSHRWQRP